MGSIFFFFFNRARGNPLALLLFAFVCAIRGRVCAHDLGGQIFTNLYISTLDYMPTLCHNSTIPKG